MFLKVFCDFDGTISKVDTVDLLLEELASPEWQEVEMCWERGEIGSRECMGRQIALLRGGWLGIEKVLEKVDIEPTFRKFCTWCHEHDISLTVLSDGIDKTIDTILKREGIEVDKLIANHLVEDCGGSLSLDFPYGATMENCQSGVCKCTAISQAELQAKIVFIGDGRSDFCCAPKADYLFAKGKLLAYCNDNCIPCYDFSSFDDVKAVLQDVLLAREGTQFSQNFEPEVVV